MIKDVVITHLDVIDTPGGQCDAWNERDQCWVCGLWRGLFFPS